MLEVPGLRSPGMAQRSSDWLVIPLDYALHVGSLGIDSGMGRFRSVEEWEVRWGRQVDLLDKVCRALGVDVWERAGVSRSADDAT